MVNDFNVHGSSDSLYVCRAAFKDHQLYEYAGKLCRECRILGLLAKLHPRRSNVHVVVIGSVSWKGEDVHCGCLFSI